MRSSSLLRVVLSAALAIAFPACTKAGGSSAAAYATKVKFAKAQVLHFPDFDLTYTGSRHVATPKYARGFDYDDFTVSHGGVSKTVSWSSGTGLIDWTDFEVGGMNFALELRGSRKFGWLKQNELVVTRQ
jgi:hypothetical protein